MGEEKTAKELADSIKNDAAALAKKGLSDAKEKLKEVDTDKIKAQAKKTLNTAKDKLDNIEIDKAKEQAQGVVGKLLGSPMSSMKFLIIYLILMIPTYVVRFSAMGAGLDDIAKGGSGQGFGGGATFILFILLLGLCFVAFLRGKTVGKKHLVAFPIVALVFDLVLVFIPFVPTVMHIITLVIGVPDKKVAETSQADELSKLADLKEQCVINEEEFLLKKKQILG